MRGQEPAAVMHELGFGRLLLLASFPVKMSGGCLCRRAAGVLGKPHPLSAGLGRVWQNTS